MSFMETKKRGDFESSLEGVVIGGGGGEVEPLERV